LSIARMVGMLTYRTTELFEERFGRNMREDVANPLTGSIFQIESYLRYQGEKLVNRFDANSYLYLMKAMDTHDIGNGRGGIAAAISRIKARVLAIGIQNDLIYPVDHQRDMAELMRQHGVDVEYHTIESKYGHDAFLVDFPKIAPLMLPYFA
jgi:homoserine O-acetyltransferase